MTIDELIESFEFLGDWEQQIEYLMDLGRKLPLAEWFTRLQSAADPAVVSAHLDSCDWATDEHKQTLPLLFAPDNLVKGCQATVYLRPRIADDGKVTFDAVANAGIVNGLIATVKTIYDGKTPREILDTDVESIIAQLKLEQHISPTRRNGLHAMLTRIRQIATDKA